MQESKTEQGMPLAGPSFRVWLCGALRVERLVNGSYEPIRTAEWGGSSYPRLLLKALLCCSGRQARREALMELLWPDAELEQAAQYLNTATTKLRAVLRPAKGRASLLMTENDSTLYRLEGQPLLWVDSDEALALLKEAERLDHSTPEALRLLEEAAAYFSKGTFLQEEEGLWASSRRATVERARYQCRILLAETYIRHGMPAQAGTVLSLLLEEDPIDQDVLCRLMELLHRQGMTHQALKLYQQTCQAIEQDGSELLETTRALVMQIQAERRYTPLITVEPIYATSSAVPPRPMLTESKHHLLPIHTSIISLELEDLAAWFGSKLSHILSIIDDYFGQPHLYQELQERIGNELNVMQPRTPDESYTHSRRQLLITLASLPTALLLTMVQGRLSARRSEQLLADCAASITACWHLMRGCEYSLVEELLSTYLPLLARLAQESSKYQHTAASLVSQGYRLKGILALHRNEAKVRDRYFQQAVYYAEIAQDPGLLVAALISLAYHQPNPVDAEQLYQKALIYERAISPLQRSRLYAELAVAYAQENHEGNAIQYLHLAQQEYPEFPENDSSFLYAEFSPSSMILEKGRVHLALTQHQPNGHYPQKAWETFASVEASQPTLIISERIRYEIINYQAETALALHDRDLCCNRIEQGARGAELLGSARRQREILIIRDKALKRWPHDGQVKELKSLFA